MSDRLIIFWIILKGLPASWKSCMQVKKQWFEPDMKQQTGSKLGKDDVKAVYCHPAYLTYMQSTSWEICMQVRKQQLELDMEQQTGPK